MRHPNEWYPLQNRTSTSLSYLEGASSWEEITHFCSSDLWWFSFCPILFLITVPTHPGASQVVLVVKNLPTNAGDAGLIPGLGRSLEGGHSNPLQYSCLEKSMDRGARWAMVHRVTKSQTQLKRLSMQACKYPRFILCLIVHMLCLIHEPGVLEIFYFFLFYVYTKTLPARRRGWHHLSSCWKS